MATLADDTSDFFDVSGQRPDWWPYPVACSHGHPWAPGCVTVSRLPCSECPGGTANHNGHLRLSCRTPGCGSVWYKPKHERCELDESVGSILVLNELERDGR